MKYIICIIGLAVIFAAGCSTNPKLAVIREARVYALEKYPDLDEESIHWIKFAKPDIREELIIDAPGADRSRNDFSQTCVVWEMPGTEGRQLVVSGFSEKDLQHWYPVRAIFKRYRKNIIRKPAKQ